MIFIYLFFVCLPFYSVTGLIIQVARADYRGRTALHFAASNGHARCIRLLVADFIPSEPYEPANFSETTDESYTRQKHRRLFIMCYCLFAFDE